MQSGKTALVTGASSGIGLELTRLFARGGYDLVLIARSEPQLKQLADELHEKFGITVKVIVKDLSVAGAPDEIFTELQQENVTVDALVNNAGYATYGLFSELDLIWFPEKGQYGGLKAGKRQEDYGCGDGGTCWLSRIDGGQNGCHSWHKK